MKTIISVLFILELSMFISCKEEKKSSAAEEENVETVKTGTLAIESSLNTMPAIVDPVQSLANDTATTQFDDPVGNLTISLELTSEQGVSLGESTQSTYYDTVSSASYGSCEMVNRMRGILHEAAKADTALCELNQLFPKEGFPEKFVDGEEHIIALTEEGNEVEKYKVKLVKNEGTLTNLVIHVCREGKQVLYTNKQINTDSTIKIVAQTGGGTDSSGSQNISYASLTEVDGTVNDKNEFVGLKTMVQTYSNDFNSDGKDVSYNKYKVIQSSKYMALNGYATQTTKTDPDFYFSFFNLIDSNTSEGVYDLNKLAVGAGALLHKDGTVSSEAWQSNGSKDSDSTLLDRVKGQESQFAQPPASESDRTELTFNGDAKWDCQGDAELTIKDEDFTDEEISDETCAHYQLPQDQNVHLECSKYQ